MTHRSTTSLRMAAVVALLTAGVFAAAPAEAQRDYEPLFDKFNFRLEGSWIEMSTQIRLDSEALGEGGNDVDGLAPLLYFYFEYRRLFSEHWRFMAGLGWLYVKVGDIDGGQWIGRATIEYLVGKRWAVGGGINLSQISVDWAGIENSEGESVLTAAVDMDINDVSLFARVRF